MIIEQNELTHYGVKGMKWGVRKDDRSGSRLKTAAKIFSPVGYAAITKGVPAAKKGIKKAKTAKAKWDADEPARIERKRQKALSVNSSARYTYKQRKHLSDAELRNRINRLNMEKQLKDLSTSNSGGAVIISSGRSAANKALGQYGAKVVVGATLGKEAAAFIKPKK